MKRYILGRVIRSFFSIFAVVTIALVLVYTLTPRDDIFTTDTTYQKLKSADDKTKYKYNTWKTLGYLRYEEQKDICANTSDYDACMVADSDLLRIKLLSMLRRDIQLIHILMANTMHIRIILFLNLL